jgi:alkylation response protein AidB-like acyl-CoA dehydrogenase
MDAPSVTGRPASAPREAVRALTARWREAGRYEPRSDNWMRGFDPAFSRELARLGLIGMTWPKQYGGAGRSHVERLAVTEELLRAGAPVAAHWIADRQIGPAILRHGSPGLRTEILPGIVRADSVFCLGMSEPEAGSDLASLRTRAVSDGSGWRLRGRKVWTSGAQHATHAYVLARTSDGDAKHQGLTEFIVDMGTPGIRVTPIPDLTGEQHFNEVTFDDVPVPGRRVLGTVGEGWRQVTEQLSFERGGPERFLSSYPLLAAALPAPDAACWPGADRELGDLAARLATLRQMAFAVAEQMDAGQAPVREAATLKYLGNAFEQDVIEFVRAQAGADGDATALLSQAILAAPGFSIRGGAAEVMLSLIARQDRPR